MGSEIDLIQVKFEKENDLSFFYNFFKKLSIGELPELNETHKTYFPIHYTNKILAFLGYGWCFIPDVPDVERLEINREHLILKLTIYGRREIWETVHLMKCMLKRIQNVEYTHYSTHTSTNGTYLEWFRNNKEFYFEDEGIPDEFYNELGDNFTKEGYFELLYHAVESGRLTGESFKLADIESIFDWHMIDENGYEIMLSRLTKYLREMEIKLEQYKVNTRVNEDQRLKIINTKIKKKRLGLGIRALLRDFDAEE